jgi:ABC-type multidrug transport system fused ATPase/permease subunit
VFWANWLGRDIVKTCRRNCFQHFEFPDGNILIHVPGWVQLVTRSVSDIESIARIFSQGLFMIISDLMKMVVVLAFMFYMNWTLTWIVIVAMPILVLFLNLQNASCF